jgi:hypothetical protein
MLRARRTARPRPHRPRVVELIEPTMVVATDPIMRTTRRGYMPRQPSLAAPRSSHPRAA